MCCQRNGLDMPGSPTGDLEWDGRDSTVLATGLVSPRLTGAAWPGPFHSNKIHPLGQQRVLFSAVTNSPGRRTWAPSKNLYLSYPSSVGNRVITRCSKVSLYLWLYLYMYLWLTIGVSLHPIQGPPPGRLPHLQDWAPAFHWEDVSLWGGL